MATYNYGLNAVSTVASGGVAHILDTSATFSAGTIVSVREAGAEFMNIAHDHTLTYTGTVAIVGAATISSTLDATGRYRANGHDIIDGSASTLYMGGLSASHTVLILRANDADYFKIDQPNGLASVLSGMGLVVSGTLAVTGTSTLTGLVLIGTTVTTSAAAGEAVIGYQKSIRAVNNGGTDTLPLISLNQSGGLLSRAMIGGGYAGSAALQILGLANASLPAAGADQNGVVVIDTTNNRIVYYSGGNRYFMAAGTAF